MFYLQQPSLQKAFILRVVDMKLHVLSHFSMKLNSLPPCLPPSEHHEPASGQTEALESV